MLENVINHKGAHVKVDGGNYKISGGRTVNHGTIEIVAGVVAGVVMKNTGIITMAKGVTGKIHVCENTGSLKSSPYSESTPLTVTTGMDRPECNVKLTTTPTPNPPPKYSCLNENAHIAAGTRVVFEDPPEGECTSAASPGEFKEFEDAKTCAAKGGAWMPGTSCQMATLYVKWNPRKVMKMPENYKKFIAGCCGPIKEKKTTTSTMPPKTTSTMPPKPTTAKPNVPKSSGLRIKSNRASIELGPNGDVKIQRTPDGKLSLDADVDIKGSVAATQVYVGGVALKEYIKMKVAEALKKN